MSNKTQKSSVTHQQVLVGTRRVSINQHFFDIVIDENGIHGFLMWRTNTVRIPGISTIVDSVKRFNRFRNQKKALEIDKNNFSISWDEFQAAVTYDHHKEIMIRNKNDIIILLFRNPKQYEKFYSNIKTRAKEKIFSRNQTSMPQSIFEGSKVEEALTR